MIVYDDIQDLEGIWVPSSPYIMMVKNQPKFDESLLIIFWMVVIGAMSLIIDYHYLLTSKAER